MALQHSTAFRNSVANALVAALNEGTIFTNAKLLLRTSDGTAAATFLLPDPPAGSAASGEVTFSTVESDSDAVGGTITTFEMQDRDGEVVVEGTVTTLGKGGDIVMYDTTVEPGNTVSITSLSYSAPL